MKMKVSDSIDNVPNENVVTNLVSDRQTNQQSDQLLELPEWLFATKKLKILMNLWFASLGFQRMCVQVHSLQ